jgi:hypothetical protein
VSHDHHDQRRRYSFHLAVGFTLPRAKVHQSSHRFRHFLRRNVDLHPRQSNLPVVAKSPQGRNPVKEDEPRGLGNRSAWFISLLDKRIIAQTGIILGEDQSVRGSTLSAPTFLPKQGNCPSALKQFNFLTVSSLMKRVTGGGATGGNDLIRSPAILFERWTSTRGSH